MLIGGRTYEKSAYLLVGLAFKKAFCLYFRQTSPSRDIDRGDHPHLNNPIFDTLVDQAAHTITESERLALYHQAEQLAISEAAVLPLYHDPMLLLKDPRVSGHSASLGHCKEL